MLKDCDKKINKNYSIKTKPYISKDNFTNAKTFSSCRF